MINFQKNQNNIQVQGSTLNRAIAIGLIVVVFVTVFFVTNIILNVYGYDFENSTAYHEVMNSTKAAANFTNGMMIDQYVQNIQNQTTLGGI